MGNSVHDLLYPTVTVVNGTDGHKYYTYIVRSQTNASVKWSD